MPDLYIIFDGPPGHESGRFVEVEDRFGKSVNSDPAEWKDRGNGSWSLGPFRPTVAVDGVTQRMARQITLAVLGDGEPNPALEICLRLFAQGYLASPLGMAEREVLQQKILRALQSGASFGEKATRVAEALAGDLVDPAPGTDLATPYGRRRAASAESRKSENDYTEPIPGGPHPLANVPVEVLEAARDVAHACAIDGDIADVGDASPIADSIVGALLPLMRPDWVPPASGAADVSEDSVVRRCLDAGMTPMEAEAWEAVRLAARALLRLIDADCQHTMEKAEMCTAVHKIQDWLAGRPFKRQLLGLDGAPEYQA